MLIHTGGGMGGVAATTTSRQGRQEGGAMGVSAE